jgi:uncharacterized protein YjbJ (UPF0337 family)
LHPTFASYVQEVKMKALPWIVVGVAVGLGVTLLLRLDEPETESATGSDAVESVARKTYGWGTKTLVGGKAASVKGVIKETTGRVTGNDRMTAEGAAERVVGDVKDAAGQLGHGAAQTIHDLNR